MNNEENLFNIEAISVVTKKRWLRTQELYSILSNIGTSNLINLIVEKLPFQPQAGEIFILNGNSINKKWKNDGHTYLTRKNGIGFREDIEKLKIGGTKVFKLN